MSQPPVAVAMRSCSHRVTHPEETFVVDAAKLEHRKPVTPYAGQRLHGAVRGAWLRGRIEVADPRGQLLTRGEA